MKPIKCYIVFRLDDPYELPVAVLYSLRSLSKWFGLKKSACQMALARSPHNCYFEIGEYGVEVTTIYD